MLKKFDALYESIICTLELLEEAFLDQVSEDIIKNPEIQEHNKRVLEEFRKPFSETKDPAKRQELRMTQIQLRKDFEVIIHNILSTKSKLYSGKEIKLSTKQIDNLIDRLYDSSLYSPYKLKNLFYLRSDNLDRDLFTSVVSHDVIDK